MTIPIAQHVACALPRQWVGDLGFWLDDIDVQFLHVSLRIEVAILVGNLVRWATASASDENEARDKLYSLTVMTEVHWHNFLPPCHGYWAQHSNPHTCVSVNTFSLPTAPNPPGLRFLLPIIAMPCVVVVTAEAFDRDSNSARHLSMTSAATGAAAQYEISEARSMFLQGRRQSGR